MKMNVTRLSGLALIGSLCAACSLDSREATENLNEAEMAEVASPDDTTDDSDVSARLLSNNSALNGFQPNGFQPNGFQPNGFEQNGIIIIDVVLNGSSFEGTRTDGKHLSGKSFKDVTFSTPIDDGRVRTMRIDKVKQGKGADKDVYFYYVLYRDHANESWKSLCGNDPKGHTVPAIPLAGYWDLSQGTATGGQHVDAPGAFTLACEGYVLADCVEMGYAPWRTKTVCAEGGACSQVSLADHHQACTRMLRADYCGDGQPHTQTGVCIDYWDDISVASQAAPEWTLESSWTPEGASCLVHARWPGSDPSFAAGSMAYIQSHCPGKVNVASEAVCSGDQWGATLLRNASPIPADHSPCGG